jgi:hypothetical protein
MRLLEPVSARLVFWVGALLFSGAAAALRLPGSASKGAICRNGSGRWSSVGTRWIEMKSRPAVNRAVSSLTRRACRLEAAIWISWMQSHILPVSRAKASIGFERQPYGLMQSTIS